MDVFCLSNIFWTHVILWWPHTIAVLLDMLRFGSALWSINQILAAAIRKRVQAGSVIYADIMPAPQVASVMIENRVAGVCTIVFTYLIMMLGCSWRIRADKTCCSFTIQHDSPLVLGCLFYGIRLKIFSRFCCTNIHISILMTIHCSWSSRYDYAYTYNQIGSRSSQHQLLCKFGFATNNFKAVDTRHQYLDITYQPT